MVPGKTYIGILPGHTKPAFIRKRPTDAGKPPWLLTQVFGATRRAYTLLDTSNFTMFSRKRCDRYYYDSATDTYRRLAFAPQAEVPSSSGYGRVATSVQQTCASCGRFRSASWQARHPLIAGTVATSSICRRCRGKHTSSEETVPRHHRKRHHHSHRHSRHCTDTTDASYSSREYVKPAPRYMSCNRDYVRPRSRSRDAVRIVIANQSGDRVAADRVVPKREYTASSSTDGIRIIRRTEVIDAPRPLRSRSKSRSSRPSYIEDGARYIEDLSRPRYHSRRRSLSRTRYVDEVEMPRHRSRRRSSSRVTFVDDLAEPVVVARPRSRLSRRRAMLFDGAADSDSVDDEVRGCAPRSDPRAQEALENRSGSEFIEEVITSRSRSSSQKDKDNGSGAELIAETVTPHSRPLAPSVTADINGPYQGQDEHFTANTIRRNDSYHSPSVEEDLTDNGSNHDVSASPAPYPARIPIVSVNDQPALSRKRSYSENTDIESHRTSPTISINSGDFRQDQDLEEPETPRHERRRRFRDAYIASDSEADDSPQPSPLNYRHVRAPSPPSPLQSPDVLAETFGSMHMEPPSEPSGYQYAPNRPTQRAHRSEGSPSRFENIFYRPDSYEEDLFEDATYGDSESSSYVFGAAEEDPELQTGYDAGWEPWMQYDTQAARDYDWMT